MTTRWAAVAAALATLLLASCAGTGAPPTTTPTAEATLPPTAAPTGAPTIAPTTTPTLAPSAPVAAQRYEVTLTDALTVEPSVMTVPVGVPVTFVVTNAGALDHEFYLGDEQMQADHAQEMADMGGMMGHDEENGIAVGPHETKELTYTFESAGTWQGACHVSSHYAAGMFATINIIE